MVKVIIMTGLPGSGKSTVAEEIIKNEENAVIICRDAIRTMLCNGYDKYKHTSVKESLVKSMAVACMEVAIERDYLVVIDETNITKERRAYWQNMANAIGERKGLNIKFMGMWVNTPKNVCIARRKANPKGTTDIWCTIIENMMNTWEDPTEDEFDNFKIIEYKDE